VNHIESLSVIIPAFNEKHSLREAISEAVRELELLGIAFEIIVVDDGSTDGSADMLAKMAAAEPRIMVVRHASNQGKGAALRSGLAAASLQWALFIDADLQVSLSELAAFCAAAPDADIVIGYRRDKKYIFQRSIISAIYKSFVKTFFGIRVKDVGCPFKLMRTMVVKSIGLSTDGFGFDVELLWRLSQSGARLVELPVESIPRVSGESKVTLGRIVFCSLELILMWLRNRIK